jgi:phenylacetate-coenzyme A ligase PaaK-like adenylate-forming protein
MANLIREERYILQMGTEEHILRVQELVLGAETWPERFRIKMPASHTREAKTFYGATSDEVVRRAVEFLSSSVSVSEIVTGKAN